MDANFSMGNRKTGEMTTTTCSSTRTQTLRAGMVKTRLAETETEDLAQEAVVNQDESISHPFLGVDDSDGRILHRLAPTPVFPRKITNRQIRYTSRWMQIFLWETGRLVR